MVLLVASTTWLMVAAIVVLMALSAFFSSSEIAMFSLERHKVERMIDEGELEGDGRADVLHSLRRDPHRLLVTILVGNNVVNIAMSSIATALAAVYLPPGQAVVATTVVISTLVLILGESAPKSYAVEHTEGWALTIAKPLQWSQRMMYPAVVFFDHVTRVVNRVTGGRSDIETSYVTKDEIEGLLKTGEKEGVIEEDEREMIESVFRFSHTIAKEIMVPRLDVVAVSRDSTVDEVLEVCVENDVTRVPVYRESLDNVEGLANIRDLVRARQMDEGLDDVVTPSLHVPETKEIDELLREMQEGRIHMAVVIDEFGSTEGIVTIEDIVEEIVGEIFELEEEKPIRRVDDRTIVVKGEVNLDEVNDALDIDLPEEGEFETVAGFIFNRMGRLVEEGETVEYDGVELTIEETDNTRILQVRIERLERGEDTAESTGDADDAVTDG